MTTIVGATVAGLRGPGLTDADKAVFTAAAEQIEAARDELVGNLPLIPTQFINSYFDPARVGPRYLFGTDLPVEGTADPFFTEIGAKHVAVMAPGAEPYMEIDADHYVGPDDWVAYEVRMSTSVAGQWPNTGASPNAAMLKLRRTADPQDYNARARIDLSYDEVDATRRIYRAIARNGEGHAIQHALIHYLNNSTAILRMSVQGIAFSGTRPGGVNVSSDDPFGLARLAQLLPPDADAVALYSNSMASSGASDAPFNSFGRAAEYFGLPVYGMANPGAPSNHVVGLATGTAISVANNTLVAGTNSVRATNGVPIVHSQNFGAFFATGQILSSPADADTRQLTGLYGPARVTLRRRRPGAEEIYEVIASADDQPAGVTLPLKVGPGTMFIPDDISPGKRTIRILMAFDNNFYDTPQCLADAADFVAKFSVDNCILFGVQAGTTAAPSEYGDDGTGSPGANFVNLMRLLARLKLLYGPAVLDPVEEQIRYGLEDSGQVLVGPARDQFDADVGHVIVPGAMRNDDRHPNNAGHISRMKRAFANAKARGLVSA